MRHKKLLALCECAIFTAMAIALSYLKIPIGLEFGGFGGSIIALVDKGRSQEVAQKIADEFEARGFHAPRALPAVAAPSASREA